MLVAYYWDGSVPMAHEIQNISSTGFYLLTDERWHLGTIVRMTLQRTDAPNGNTDTDNYISVLSKVVRLGEDGVGFAFVPLETKSSNKVNALKTEPVGRKALGKFLEQFKLEQGCATIGASRRVFEKGNKLDQDGRPAMHAGNFMKGLGDESGQALIMVALCTTCLFGFVALAADVGIMLREKRLLQIAADSAAIAGAAEYNYGDASTAAQSAATQNGFTNAAGGATIAVNSPPSFGPHAAIAGYVEVIASQSEPTLFMGFFGRSAMTVTARAVATALGTTNGCIYTLGTGGVDVSVTGNSDISIATCGITIDSNSSNALSLNGNVTLDAQSIGIVGGYSKTGNVTLTPTPVTGIVATSDPLGFLTAPAIPGNCAADPSYTGNQNPTLTAGCYNGLSGNGNINLTLSPGMYIINGAFSFSGNVSLTGSGVTLVLEGSTSLPGNVSLNLTAPTSGTYNGILIFQPSTNANALALTGNSGSVFKGIVYAPNTAVSLTGNSGSSIYADFVAKSLSLVGNASLNDYASINGNSVLSAVRLVE
jgi:Flp pilus assembly protein TadG